MFDSFTPTAKAVADSTFDIAARLGHNYVGTEHLLLALLAHEERTGGGPLTDRGVTTAKVTEHALAWLAKSLTDRDALATIGIEVEAKPPPPEMAVTPRVFKVLHLAVGIAVTNPVTNDHLLQALLEEDGGLAVIVLDKLRVDLDGLRAAVETNA